MNQAVNVLLISTYELGRQPFGLASPAAWLRADGRRGLLPRSLATGPRRTTGPRRRPDRLLSPHAHRDAHRAQRDPQVRDLNPVGPTLRLWPLRARSMPRFCARPVSARSSAANSNPLSPPPRAPSSTTAAAFLRRRSPTSRSTACNSSCPTAPACRRSRNTRGWFMPDGSAAHRRLHRGQPWLQAPLPPLPRRARLRRQVSYRATTISCSRTFAARSLPAPSTSPSATPTSSTASPTRSNWCARCTREFPRLTYDVTIKVEHLLQHAAASSRAARHRLRLRHHRRRVARRSRARPPRQGPHARRLRPPRLAVPRRRPDPGADLCRLHTLDHARRAMPTCSTPSPTSAWSKTSVPVQLAIRLLIPAGSRLLELPEVRDLVGRLRPRRAQLSLAASRSARGRAPARDRAPRAGAARRRSRPPRHLRARAQPASCTSPTTLPLRACRCLPAIASRATVPYLTEPWYC